jgi:hypothetical protein
MEKKNYRVWEYELLLWKKAINDTVKLYRTDWRAWIGNLISIVIALSTLRALVGVQAMSSQLTTVIAGLIGAVGGGLFILIVHRMSAPLILYREKEIEANKRSWRDIEFKPYRFPENSGFEVGLQVISSKPSEFQVTNVYCQITEIRRGWDVIFHGNMQLPLLFVPSFERRHEIINQSQFTKLVSGEAIAVANDDGTRAWIQENDATTDVTIDRDVVHKLTLSINGVLFMNVSMDGCLIWCDLLYHQNKENGKMELSLSISEREPRYNP